ncbi:GNAT family N-acetyltransferase [Facklamia lactis]|uniref:GNAT family N-acetyltransferase n=1 Tax=Facklamia lactis TaxID=2749967 RepID=UPI0018CE204D|nr:GNAT family N-acetyltransferase [Facklamia lactis]MBG9979430.1 GNAT family N-acetyltransferase [Facklamia lactis]
MYIETERLIIRKLEWEDLNGVFHIYQDQETCQFLLHDPWTEANKEQNFTEMIEKSDLEMDRAVNLAVVRKHHVIGIFHVWYTEMKKTVEVGYTFSKEYSGKGYATETLKAMIDFIFKHHDVHRIQAVCDDRNVSSEQLCLRAGMRKEAHFIKDFWNKGEWTSSFVFGILREEYKR